MAVRRNLGYIYPERSDEHMITVKHLRDTHFDENYNYLGWKSENPRIFNYRDDSLTIFRKTLLTH